MKVIIPYMQILEHLQGAVQVFAEQIPLTYARDILYISKYILQRLKQEFPFILEVSVRYPG